MRSCPRCKGEGKVRTPASAIAAQFNAAMLGLFVLVLPVIGTASGWLVARVPVVLLGVDMTPPVPVRDSYGYRPTAEPFFTQRDAAVVLMWLGTIGGLVAGLAFAAVEAKRLRSSPNCG